MRRLADLLYQTSCVGCRRPARGGFCRVCFDEAHRLEYPQCKKCGAPLPGARCSECRGRGFAFDRAVQAFYFKGTVRAAIHRLKYRGERELAETLVFALDNAFGGNNDSVVTWIPSTERRISERGFDHGRMLADEFAKRFGIHAAQLLERVKDTMPQVKLSQEQRRISQSGSMRSRIPSPRRVIVIDDVFTTGATISEAARALKESGAECVVALCLARSLLLDSNRPYNRSGP